MLQATLVARQRVLGSAHPDTLATTEDLELMRSKMRAKQPAKRGGKAVARRKERAAVPLLSLTALAEAVARAGVAETELLAMLELEEGAAESGTAKGKAKGKAEGNKGARG
jgi:hypothetical protein